MEHLVITTLCNNNCINCINSYDNRKAVHPYSFYFENKEKIEKERHVSIGGGEPTIHPEFFDIISLVNSCGNEYTLLTNGRAFASKSFFDRFISLGLDKRRLRIGTAIYGDTEELHDCMTKTKGSFKQTMLGLKKLIMSGFRVELRLIVTKKNYRDLSKIAELISKELSGVERVSFINMKVTGEAYKNREDLLVPYSKSMSETKKAADILLENKIPLLFLHFPLCVLPRRYWVYTKGVTIQDNQIVFSKKCDSCIEKDSCSGIWKSYYQVQSDSEFNPIKINKKRTIAFVFPFSKNNNFFPVPPLSLASIAGFFRSKDIEISQIDLESLIWNFNSINKNEPIFSELFFEKNPEDLLKTMPEQIVEYIEKIVRLGELSRFNTIGFSIMGGEYLPPSLLIARYLKEKYNTEIVFGGIYTHPFKDYLDKFSFIDKVFVGRAENEMYNYFFEKNNTQDSSMDHDLVFPTKKLYEEASSKLFGENNLFYPYELSQGCIHKCKFCLPRKYSKFSLKDPDKAILEISNIAKKYTNKILFYDCAINISKSNFKILMEGFKKIGIKYSCYAMPDFSEEEAVQLNESGCFNVRLGIETMSNDLLKSLNKPIQNKNYLQSSIDNLAKSNIKPLLLFISDIPGQTKEDIDSDVDFIRKNKEKIYGVSVSEYSIHYGTDQYMEYEDSLVNEERLGVPIDSFVSGKELKNEKLFEYYLLRLEEEGVRVVSPGKCLGFEEFLKE